MIRRVILGLFGTLLGAMIGVVALDSSSIGQDKVERRDRKTDKNVVISGQIKDETSAGYKLKVGIKEEIIPAADVVQVYYDDIPLTLKVGYQNLVNSTEKDLAKIVKDNRDYVAKALSAPDLKAPVKRYLEYRMVMLDAVSVETDEAKANVRKALSDFVRENPNCWEYAFAARTLARMLVDRFDYDGAVKVLTALSKNTDVPADMRQEADILLIDVLFQAGKADEVKSKIAALTDDPKTTEAQKARFRIYSIGLDAQGADAKIDEVAKKLDEVIAKTPDNSIKALAYNVLGDCYMLKQRKRDAMWSYLWVDVVYSQDKTELTKAMAKLLAIFDEEKDTEKIQHYKEKMQRLR